MARSRISQREARRLKKRVQELEAQENWRRHNWAQVDWPSATTIASAQWGPLDSQPVAIRTARKLNHAVVATVMDNGLVTFLALPLKG